MIRIFGTLLILFVTLLFVQPVSAGGHGPRIDISTDRLNPGDTLDIRGVDFEYEEIVVLDLVSPQAAIPFGTVLADVEGVFLLTITLPVDIAEGTYVIRATTEDDIVVESAQITVWGAADLGGGEYRDREERSSLLVPMPTHVLAESTSVAQMEYSDTVPDSKSSAPIAGIALFLGAVLIIAIVRVARR
jgi:hypothetical protein